MGSHCSVLGVLWLVWHYSVSRLVEVIVPPFRSLLRIYYGLCWRFLSFRWIVIKDLFLLFLCVDHTFDLVQDLFVHVRQGLRLFLTLLLLVVLLDVTLSFL